MAQGAGSNASVATAFQRAPFDQSVLDVMNGVLNELKAARSSLFVANIDFANIATLAQDISNTVACAGAALGDFVEVSCSVDLQGMQLSGYVSSAGVVTLVMRNGTGGGINLAAADYRVRVTPKATAALSPTILLP